MRLILDKSDTFGAIVSFLCLVHCITTPFVIIVIQSYASEGITINPIWWQNLDSILLIISLIAVVHSTKNTSKSLIKIVLWISWIALSLFIFNEKFYWFSFPELGTYVSSITLASFHVLNMKYCKCETCAHDLESK